ncbi:MAG: recombination mediator RecR [Burkholderiaceae bacterium]
MTTNFSSIVDNLVKSLSCLPGIGPKTAQRMAVFLLQHNREVARKLSTTLEDALVKVKNCIMCNSFSEEEVCFLCSNPDRDDSLLCIVETPVDQMVMEQTKVFRGKYYVLMGKLSPIEGIGPEELNFKEMIKRVAQKNIGEVIIATNFTPEGEATAHAIESTLVANNLVPPRRLTRLARGVPLGAEIEFTDLGTIAQAVRERKSK